MASGRRPYFTTDEGSNSTLFRLQYPTRPQRQAGRPEAPQFSGPDRNLLKCQICLHFPRKEVFICLNGHSVCHVCMLRTKTCPSCRAPYESDRVGPIRNYALEALLDSMKFPCEWKDAGCLEKGLPRSNLIGHEAQCRYNPEAVNFCIMSRLSRDCPYKFSPKAMLEDSDQVKQLMTHMSEFHYTVKSDTTTSTVSSHKLNDWYQWTNSDSSQVSYIFSLTDRITGRTLGIYMVFLKMDLSMHGRLLSWNLISLVGPPQQQQQVTANFYLMKNKRSETAISALWGAESVPSMMWSAKPMDINQYQDFLSVPLKQRLEKIFTMPVPHLETFYVEEAEEGTSADLTWHISFQCTDNAA